MNKPRKSLYAGIAALGIAALSAFAWYAQQSDAPKPIEAVAVSSAAAKAKPAAGANGGASIAVEVAKVSVVGLQEDIRATGTLQSNDAVMLRPEVAGRISRINFTDGQRVNKGQLLLAFDSAVARAEVQQVEAELRIARANLQRNTELAEQRFIAERVREESAAAVQVLEAKLALVQARLDKLEIRAPFSGIMGISNVSVGDYVKDGIDIAHLQDISQVKVDFRIPERFIGQIRKGQQMELAVDAYPQETFHARVDAIDPQVESSGRSVLLRGRIANSDLRLKPGMFARVRLVLAERGEAMMVPEEALVPHGQDMTVWKIVDGKAQRTAVRTGLRRDAQVEVTEGVQAGDVVVIAGHLRLSRDGMPVRVTNVEKLPTSMASNPEGSKSVVAN